MARRDQVVEHLQVADLERRANAPVLIHVKGRLLVHSRSGTSGTCWCCNSPVAKIDDIRPDLEVLIHTRKGTRDLKHNCVGSIFDRVAEGADLTVDAPMRCSPQGLELILSDRRITVAQGASRSSKTQHGIVWGFRQWMLRGGPGVEALFCGPEMMHAHLLLRKWCKGEGPESPPVCDPQLVVSYPRTTRDEDQTIRMVDGTAIHLKHLKYDGRNIAGLSPAWINVTELAKVKDEANWGQIRTRVVSTRGQIYVDAVPEPGHFVKRGLIDPAVKEEVAEQQAIERGEPLPDRSFLVRQLAADDNPWNAAGEGAAATRDIAAMNSRMAQRMGEGEWVSNRNLVFGEFVSRENLPKLTFDYEGWDVEHLGLVDVTRAASMMHFHRAVDWIVAVDVNGWPHTALIGKMAVHAEHARGVSRAMHGQIERKHWIAVFFEYKQDWGIDSMQAAERLASFHRGRFAGAGVVMDGTSAYKKHNAGGAMNKRKRIVPFQAYKRAGFAVKAPDKTSAQGLPANPERMDSSICGRRILGEHRALINARRCAPFIDALRDQEAEPDGITPRKFSGTYQDAHVVSGTDVFRYWTWPFFRLDKPDKPQREVREYA